MPEYRVVYLLVYRLRADGDLDAAGLVSAALAARYPKAKFKVVASAQCRTDQQVAGETRYDVRIAASGEVSALNVVDSLTKVTPAPVLTTPRGTAMLRNSVEMASIDTRVEGEF